MLILIGTIVCAKSDICYQYQISIADGSARSYCDDENFCQNLPERISCDDAFNRLIDMQKVLTDIPPIVSQSTQSEHMEITLSERMYHEIMMLDDDPDYFPFAQPPRRDDVDDSMLEPEYMDFIGSTNLVVSSIIDRFPKLVYNETSDGNILRQFVQAARTIRRISVYSPGIVLAVHQSDSMRQFAWAIRMMFDHIIVASSSFKQTERLLVSMSPWLHAFLHALFLIETHYDRLLDDVASWDIINAIVKYHPLYTGGDGVWYVRTTKRWDLVLSRPPLAIDGPDHDHILSLWDNRDPLEASIRAFITSDDFESLYDFAQLSSAYLTLNYFREASNVSLHGLNLNQSDLLLLDEYVQTNYYAALHGRVVVADIFSDCLSPENLLHVVSAYATANNYLSMRSGNHRRVLTINKSQMAVSTIYILSAYSKYDLAGEIEFLFIDHSDVRETPRPYPGGTWAFHEDLLDEIFDIRSGFFERSAIGSYTRTDSAGPLALFLTPFEVSVAIGRILASYFWQAIRTTSLLVTQLLGRIQQF